MSFFQNNNFNPDTVEDDGPADFVLPPGKYRVTVLSAEEEPCAGNGLMLKLDLVILDGKHADWHIWDNILLKHNSEKAVEVGKKKLKRLCTAAGLGTVTDSRQFVGKTVTVTTKNEDYNNQKYARVKFYDAPSAVSQGYQGYQPQMNAGATQGSGYEPPF
ncbi:MAG: DUF669 domain-containing protein [bacterium]